MDAIPQPLAEPRTKPASGIRGLLTWVWLHRMAGLTLLLSLSALSYFAIPFLLGPTVIGVPVAHADFVQSIVASGHVEASFRVNIGSQITGIVVEVPVSEGQAVKTGDVLIRLDDHEARSAVVAATSAVAEAEARMRQMEELTLPSALEDVKQAQANRINAVASHFRTATLAANGDATKVALDDATRDFLTGMLSRLDGARGSAGRADSHLAAVRRRGGLGDEHRSGHHRRDQFLLHAVGRRRLVARLE